MPDSDPICSAGNGLELISKVITIIGDNPHTKETVDNLGKSIATITTTVDNILLPLAAINFAIKKAKIYFSEQFPQDIAETAKAIPPDQIIEPKASIAGPILQGLAFTHEEPNLKEMYLKLLATSMDGRYTSLAHPAFVEIIKQFDCEEARLVRRLLQSSNPSPIVQILREVNSPRGFQLLASHLINLIDQETGIPVEDPHIPAMIDNWVRLGLAEVKYDTQLTDDSLYSWADQRPEFLHLSQEPQANGTILKIQKGIIQRTAFGKRFAIAIGVS